MPKIAIDLVPLRPGGVNGGAGVMARYLLDHLDDLGTEFEFVLLTAPWNHADLDKYARPSVQVIEFFENHTPATRQPVLTDSILSILDRGRLSLPPALVRRLLPAARRIKHGLGAKTAPPADARNTSPTLQSSFGVDILFCPFTAVTYAEPGLEVISFVHDLQHRVYPQFFRGEEIRERDDFFTQMVYRSNRILCNSEFTRKTLCDHFPQTGQIPTTIVPVSIHTRLLDILPEKNFLEKHELAGRPYLFYPANFWPHKNHRMLLTAFGIYLNRNPDSDCDLVFTGASSEAAQDLKNSAEKMGLGRQVRFLDYLPDSALAAVYQNCTAMIYPSLYEGFGVPILEAFQFGVPVLCSRAASLPEVAGEAALYFDPRKPVEIVETLETLFQTPELSHTLASRAQERLKIYAPEKMLASYSDIFKYG